MELFSIRRTWGPLFFIACCPPLAILLWYTHTQLQGSLTALITLFQTHGLTALKTIWGPVFFGSPVAWLMIAVFAGFEVILMKILPGKIAFGPVTPKGNVPLYKANGPLAYSVTLITFILCTFVWHLFPATLLYDHMGELLGALNILSLVFCLFLALKGRYFPSSSDSGPTGNVIFDYYWGTELYPRVFTVDVKMLTNCRFGMMSWSLLLLSYAAKQHQLYGLSNAMVLSVFLQLFYVAKFFYWETGYLRSIDIMHDRAGFYICWGCLVWVPCVYTSVGMYLVHHPYHFAWWLFTVLLVAGIACILINFLADRQRQMVRHTHGKCTIWGKKPALLSARYTSTSGEERENLLLVSGWWGIARHFHYVPEILGAFFWTVPALFTNVLPFFYVVFLTFLLLDRALRDEKRCAKKYGEDWNTYCEKVPYKMIPKIF